MSLCFTGDVLPLLFAPLTPRRVKLVDRVKSGEQLDKKLTRWAWSECVNHGYEKMEARGYHSSRLGVGRGTMVGNGKLHVIPN